VKKKFIYYGIQRSCAGDTHTVLATQLPLPQDEQPKGTFRILSVEQRHEHSQRTVMLLDAESMGETKTDVRKRQFTYQLVGVSDAKISPGSWLLSPREDICFVLEVNELLKNNSGKKLPARIALRVKFDETGIIRLNETWVVFKKQPITRREMGRWEQRMTEGATRYYWQILPGVLDSILFEPTEGVNGEQVKRIRNLHDQILYQAIKVAKNREAIKLTSTHLVDATRVILQSIKTD
jgi:hypothetical protein